MLMKSVALIILFLPLSVWAELEFRVGGGVLNSSIDYISDSENFLTTANGQSSSRLELILGGSFIDFALIGELKNKALVPPSSMTFSGTSDTANGYSGLIRMKSKHMKFGLGVLSQETLFLSSQSATEYEVFSKNLLSGIGSFQIQASQGSVHMQMEIWGATPLGTPEARGIDVKFKHQYGGWGRFELGQSWRFFIQSGVAFSEYDWSQTTHHSQEFMVLGGITFSSSRIGSHWNIPYFPLR